MSVSQTHRLARVSDPDTSHDAAVDAAPRFATVRPAVLAVLKEHGPLTLDQLVTKYKMGVPWREWPMSSDSSVRTRCAELVRAGLVERVTDRMGESRFGKPAYLWQAKEETR